METAADFTLNRLFPHDFGVIFAIRGAWDATGQFGEKTRSARRLVFFEMRNSGGHACRMNRLAATVKVSHDPIDSAVSVELKVLLRQQHDDLTKNGAVKQDAAKQAPLSF
jgi:hypothetical protein